MSKHRKNDDGRFGIEPREDVIDQETAKPSLTVVRTHLGFAEMYYRQAAEALEKCDEKGRDYLIAGEGRSDLSALGECGSAFDDAIAKLSLSLASAVRSRQILGAVLNQIAAGHYEPSPVSER